MYLAPFLRLGVPEFHSQDTGTGHGKVRSVEHVAGVGIYIGAIETEDLEDAEIAGEGHGDAFGAAFLVGGGCGAEDAGPGLRRLVVGADGFAGDGICGWVFGVEVEDSRGSLLEKFSSSVAEEFVDADLDFEGYVAVLSVQY